MDVSGAIKITPGVHKSETSSNTIYIEHDGTDGIIHVKGATTSTRGSFKMNLDTNDDDGATTVWYARTSSVEFFTNTNRFVAIKNLGDTNDGVHVKNTNSNGSPRIFIEGGDGSNLASGIYSTGGAGGAQAGFMLEWARGTGAGIDNNSTFGTYLTTQFATNLYIGTNGRGRVQYGWQGDITTFAEDGTTPAMFFDAGNKTFTVGSNISQKPFTVIDSGSAEQVRIMYDLSNHMTYGVNSSGHSVFNNTGNKFRFGDTGTPT